MGDHSEVKSMLLLIKKISELIAIKLPEAELCALLIYCVFVFFQATFFKEYIKQEIIVI